MAVSRFWYSAYRDFTVDQIERNARIADGLRKAKLSRAGGRRMGAGSVTGQTPASQPARRPAAAELEAEAAARRAARRASSSADSADLPAAQGAVPDVRLAGERA